MECGDDLGEIGLVDWVRSVDREKGKKKISKSLWFGSKWGHCVKLGLIPSQLIPFFFLTHN